MNFDLEDTRRKLITRRVAAGTDTQIGHRCSNLIELLDNYGTADTERAMDCYGWREDDPFRKKCCFLNMELAIPSCRDRCGMDRRGAIALDEVKRSLMPYPDTAGQG